MNERRVILIVEDDSAVAGMIEDHLTASGYVTDRAADGREAVERVRQSPPDLIVMDLMMPHLTGGEAAKELRRDPLTSHIPIVAISAVADVTSIADFLPLDEVLPKPFDLIELERAIQRHLPSLSDDPAETVTQPSV
ncbi:MAG TPA: response regulator transcription factor [Thermomicrobiales bacterium]|nr:response regulator transcription factor [Thermomicrobiales bacterium]